MKNSHPNIELYKSLFRGREDVYAVRWEKEERSGYMPAYKVDWTDYNKHKASGGTFANYTKKEFLPFNDVALTEHLKGTTTLGVYPLLTDNTSFFIVADFDEDNWQDAILKLYEVCKQHELPTVIERSRSGNGGIYGYSLKKIFLHFRVAKLCLAYCLKPRLFQNLKKNPASTGYFLIKILIREKLLAT